MLSLSTLVIVCMLYSAAGNALTKLRNLEDEFWDWRMRISPEYSTAVGYTKYNDRLESFDPYVFSEMKTVVETFLSRLETIRVERLPRRETVNYAVLQDTLKTFLDGYKWRNFGALNPASFMEGRQRDPEFTISITPFNNIGDFENYLKRLQEMPKQIQQYMHSFRKAIAYGRTYHNVSVNRVPEQIDRIIQHDYNNSMFYQPFLDNLEKLMTSSYRRQDLRNHAREAVQMLNDELQLFKDFILQEYIPNTRKGWGVSSWDGGSEYYKECLKWHLSIDMTPDQVHRTGRQEVKRIHRQMLEVSSRHGFGSDVQQFFASIKNNSTFYINSSTGILRAFRQLIKNRIAPVLPQYFRNMPDAPLRVVALPTDGPAAMYRVSDGKRPGMFHVNVVRPEKVPTFDMIALALHEGLPGHHTQTSISLAAPKLPKFRKTVEYRNYVRVPFLFPFYTAYTEGWGLYAESLGEDLGLYKDDYELMGRYNYEIFRACRLVVDTGIHYFNWTRGRAVEYVMENTAFERQIVENEIDRYITWPGQACAYKIGELKILDLRRIAEKTLGEHFDIRDFHAVVLENGAVPLHLLEKEVEEWVESVQTAVNDKKRADSLNTIYIHSSFQPNSTGYSISLSAPFKLFSVLFLLWRVSLISICS